MNITDIIEIAVLFILFILFIIWFLLIIHSIKLANRLHNHVLKKPNNDDMAMLDKLLTWYKKKKIEVAEGILEISSKKKKTNDRNKQIKDIYSLIDSFVYAILFVITYILISIFYIQKINLFSSILAFLLGFILPGIIDMVKHELNKKNIEKELLKSIIIINNNLQANKSIKEALIDTKDKLNGPLRDELSNVINDLDHGLSLEVAFKRMKNRCEVNDVTYLTTTLAILSKTGGNTKEAFNYLEDLFQTRKKLNQELDATIASSKLVYMILSVLPIIVFIGMLLMYDNYLQLYLTTNLGYLLIGIQILLYITYILIIRKIMIIDKY